MYGEKYSLKNVSFFHIYIDIICHIYYNTIVFENNISIFLYGGGNSINHKYTLIESDAGGRANVYGIEIVLSAQKSVCYPYISENVKDTEHLLMRMKNGNIAFEHIGDIVRDYITELYFEKLSINGF